MQRSESHQHVGGQDAVACSAVASDAGAERQLVMYKSNRVDSSRFGLVSAESTGRVG